jgi:hypothetical protein
MLGIAEALVIARRINRLLFGRSQKKISRPRSHEQFSLTFYICRPYKLQSYFPRWLGHSYFFFPTCFLWFFSLKLIGPRRNLVWFGGYQNECFSLIEQLTFLFTKIDSYTKLTQCISKGIELTIPNHFSSSLNLFARGYMASQSQKWAKITSFYSWPWPNDIEA